MPFYICQVTMKPNTIKNQYMTTCNEDIIKQTKNWICSFIIKLNICPFAKREVERGAVRFQVAEAIKLQQALEELLMEFMFLDSNPSVETSFLIFPSLFNDFFVYLDFVDYAELLIRENEYEGIYQLATFHPNYCFAEVAPDDATNYTNRSPYPMLHILREDSLDKAIAHYGDTEKIPENNIKTMRKLGIESIKKLLSSI